MKPELNKKDQAKQNKLRKMLSLGQALSRLFGGSGKKTKPGKESEEVPDFVTEGFLLPIEPVKRPKKRPKPGKPGRSASSENSGRE